MSGWSAIGGEIGILIIFFTLVYMQWYSKLPSPDEVGHYFESINTKGGNIFLLFLGTMYCAWLTGRFIYHLIDLEVEHRLDPTNAIAMVGLTFFTSTLTGGFAAVLFKTMTGEGPAQPIPQRLPSPPPAPAATNTAPATPPTASVEEKPATNAAAAA